MRYILRQKMLSFADDFQVKDENGGDAFVVDGKAFSIAKQLSLQDLSGNTIVSITQQLLSWGPSYQISNGDSLIATVKKELFNVFSYRFSIELADSSALQATGDFSNHEYGIYRGDAQVAAISKQWFSLTDTYGIDIGAGEDDAFILAIAVVIDMVCHPDHR